MKSLTEDATICSFESTPSERQRSDSVFDYHQDHHKDHNDYNMQSQIRDGPQRRSVGRAKSLNNLLTLLPNATSSPTASQLPSSNACYGYEPESQPPSSLPRQELHQARPGSPRSTLSMTTEHDDNDGVILTRKTGRKRMSRRNSTSRLLLEERHQPPASRSQTARATSNDPASLSGMAHLLFDHVRPGGLKRRNSVRGTSQRLQQQERSTSARDLWNTTGSSSHNIAAAAKQRQQQRVARRNSMGSTYSTSSLVTTSSANSSAAMSTQSARPRLRRALSTDRQYNSGRALLQRTASFRKTDSSREVNPNASVATTGSSTRGLARTHSLRNADPLMRGGSLHSQGSVGNATSSSATRRMVMQRESSLADLMVDCNTTVSVSNTWASIRVLPDYQRKLGEQVILRLIEANPETARSRMRLESFFSDRFNEICKTLNEVLDMIVTLLGPDLDEAADELARLGQTCRDQGIELRQLGHAVSHSMQFLLRDEVTPDMTRAWQICFDSLQNRLARPVSSL